MFLDGIKALLQFLEIYSWLFLINIIFSGIIIFAERKSPTSTILWIMTINFLPFIGIILYLFIGQDISKQRIFKKSIEESKEVKRISEKQLKLIEDDKFYYNHIETKKYKDMIKMFNISNYKILTQDNFVKIYTTGKDVFDDLFEDIKNAKSAIYIESYILISDKLGDKLIDLLVEKANEGLEVILLIDGMGARKFKYLDRKKLKKAGVKLAIFFPGVFPKINTHINYRNHRKIYIIDHKIGYVGGFNIGDEYIDGGKKFNSWRDTHLRIVGKAVNELQWQLFMDYRFASHNEDGGFLTLLDENSPKGNKDICIVASGPSNRLNSIRNGYAKIINKAKKKIYIQTPYFVPDDGLFKALKMAALSGCEVNIMIPLKKDHLFVHWASMSYIGELLEWGINAYLYDDGFLHSKVVICDDYLSSVGTANFDIRSFELNFEVNAFIFDKEINKKLEENFKMDIKKSKKINLEKYRKRPINHKIRESISRLLSPLL